MSGTQDDALQIRPAAASDILAVASIEGASFPDPWSAASFRSVLREPEAMFLVAEYAGEIVGYSVSRVILDEGELCNVAVDTAWRGKGIGRALLQEVTNLARLRGATRMFLEVRESNRAARQLYQSLGFREVGRRKRYYSHPAEDALVMHVELGGGTAPGKPGME